MHHNTPLDRIKMQLAINPAVNASGGLTGAEIDTKGYSGVMFICPIGALDGLLDLKIMGSTTSGGTLTTITGAEVTQVTAGQDNHIVAISIYRPTCRYLKAIQTTTGTTGANNGVVAMLFDPEGLTPVTQHTDVSEIVEVVEN